MPLLDVIDGEFDVIDGGFNVVTGEDDPLSPPPGYLLLFEDVFSAAGNPAYAAATPLAPALPDPAKWGTPESATLPGHASVDGSKLVLRATGTNPADRTSSGIRTSDSLYLSSWRGGSIGFTRMWPAPGWLEVIAKPSEIAGVMSEAIIWGTWRNLPFGTTDQRYGEIDLFEARGFQPGTFDFDSHHWNHPNFDPNPETPGHQNLAEHTVGNFMTGIYHQFVAHFSHQSVRLYCDGILSNVRTRIVTDPVPIFGYPMALVLGCWIGTVGDGWAGVGGVDYPIDTALEVQSVRYYTQGAIDDGAWL